VAAITGQQQSCHVSEKRGKVGKLSGRKLKVGTDREICSYVCDNFRCFCVLVENLFRLERGNPALVLSEAETNEYLLWRRESICNINITHDASVSNVEPVCDNERKLVQTTLQLPRMNIPRHLAIISWMLNTACRVVVGLGVWIG